MNRRALLSSLGTATVVAMAGCAGGNGGGAATTTASDGDAAVTVEMVNTSFEPRKAEVSVGSTVKWVNKDAFQHDVTSAQFSSGATQWDFAKTLSEGQTATYTFQNPGIYEYRCTIHGKNTMCGVVLVGDVTYQGTLPCAGDSDGGYNY